MCVCVHVVMEGKGRVGPGWQGQREPGAGVWAAFGVGFGESRWKGRIWVTVGAMELQLESRAVFSEK